MSRKKKPCRKKSVLVWAEQTPAEQSPAAQPPVMENKEDSSIIDSAVNMP